jgi:hypothetical protein
MVTNTINIYKVRNKIVDENSEFDTVLTGRLNLADVKKEAKRIFDERHNQFITGTLIRVNKEDSYHYNDNEYFIYYDGKNFKRKFNLFWDMKEVNEFLGLSRFEPVLSLKDM